MASLTSMPPEIVAHIASFLAPECLANLSLTCHFLCNATTSTLFQKIYLCPARGRNYPQHIGEDLEQVILALLRRDAVRFVRTLRVTGVRQWTARLEERYGEYDTKIDYEGWSTGMDSHIVEDHNLLTRERAVAATYAFDHKWIPLAHFLPFLPCLEDLVYAHPRCQFSPCLLAALPPTCRLHLETFSMRSLFQETQAGASAPGLDFDVDPYELELATSPNLRSIVWAESMNNDSHHGTYDEEAVHRLVSDGLAPNLEKLHFSINLDTQVLMDGFDGVLDQPPPSFVSWPRKGTPPSCIAPVEDLCVTGTDLEIVHDRRANWISSFQGTLRKVRLIDASPDFLRTLVANPPPAIQELDISVDRLSSIAAEVLEVTRQLIRSSPPLECLSIADGCALLGHLPLYQDVIESHGTRLRMLCLPGIDKATEMTASLIRSIGDSCPHLNGLHICLPRSEGSCDEVALYTALGGIARLQHLTIELDYFQPSVITHHNLSQPNWFEELPFHCAIFNDDGALFEEVYNQGSLPMWAEPDASLIRVIDARAAVINAAIDQHLIEAIFQHILATQRSLHPLPSLDRLDIQLCCHSERDKFAWSIDTDINTDDLLNFCYSIGQPWRSIRSQDPSGNDRLQSFPTDNGYATCVSTLKRPQLFALLTAWPDIEVADWKHSWRSAPLCDGSHPHSGQDAAAVCGATGGPRDCLTALTRTRQLWASSDVELDKVLARNPDPHMEVVAVEHLGRTYGL